LNENNNGFSFFTKKAQLKNPVTMETAHNLHTVVQPMYWWRIGKTTAAPRYNIGGASVTLR
jgi:hypothetical protein